MCTISSGIAMLIEQKISLKGVLMLIELSQ
jgi:hypothetical protein